MIGRNPGSGVQYQEQSLHVQVRIPFTQRAVQVRLETPYGHMARLMREAGYNDRAAIQAGYKQMVAAGDAADARFWAGMRADGVPVTDPEPEPELEAEL